MPAEIYHLKAAGEANWPKMDAGDREGRGGAARGPADHRRHVHLHRRLHGLRRLPSALGAGGRLREPCRSPAGPADAAPPDRRDARRRRRAGKTSAHAGGLTGGMLLLEFKTDALKPLIGKTLAEVAAMRGKDRADTSSTWCSRTARGWASSLPDVRGERAQADPAALGVLRVRRRLDGHGRRLPEVVGAPPRLRQLRAPARQVRARGEAHPARGGGPAADRPARRQPRPRPPRPAARGDVRGRRRLRPRDDRRPRHLRAAAPVRGGRAARVRERRAGPARRRAHRRHCRAGRSRVRGLVPRGGEALGPSRRDHRRGRVRGAAAGATPFRERARSGRGLRSEGSAGEVLADGGRAFVAAGLVCGRSRTHSPVATPSCTWPRSARRRRTRPTSR